MLLAEGLLGGFHFNNRKYADDDLIVGSIDPFELFRIMREIARRGRRATSRFMIDQSHNVEGKIDAMIQSVMNIQTAYAKALLVDETRLADGAGAKATCSAPTACCSTHSRPTSARCWPAAGGLGVDPDPVAAFREGGYAERSRASAAPPRSRAPTSSCDRTHEQAMTQRSAFVLRVRPEQDRRVRRGPPRRLAGDARRLPRRRHPQLHDLPAGNQVFGYFEADDLDAAERYLAQQDVCARWQDAMARAARGARARRRAASARRDLPARLK